MLGRKDGGEKPGRFQLGSHWGWDGTIAIPGLVLSLIVMGTPINLPLRARLDPQLLPHPCAGLGYNYITPLQWQNSASG